nr:ImmA/IrrE family metallo-endopeptidase [uncultured Trichococcus sp.]
MQRVLSEAKELGIDVHFIELKKDGYSLIELKMIFINQDLHEEKAIEVLIHELAHFKLHSEYSILYKMSVPHLKMEQEAINYAVEQIIEDNDGVYNYTQLIEEFKIGMGSDVRFANYEIKKL